ncbi:uncharacterized protein LOC135959267 [Calliphora vicina]|uniref:uncharacterized protein LOC135959267 n=1 Tax=Calliphora vicina TaxID=7373 RepID=UPI00325BEF59
MSKFTDHFNSTTIKGRANVAKATYASFAAIYLYSRFKKSKRKPNENPKTNDSNLYEPAAKSEGNESLQHFKCPRCECNKDSKNSTDSLQKPNERQDLHELTPPAGSCKSNHDSSSYTPHTNDGNNAAVAESMVKSSKSKCESGCITATTHSSTITNEQKSSLHSADDKELLWCYTI